jgi:hypothetical protein
MVEGARHFIRENSTLFYFLFAQSVVLVGAGASVLSYFTRLDVRVTTMEERGAAYTVARMDEMKLRIQTLEGQTKRNEQSIDRIVDTMTKRLNINP